MLTDTNEGRGHSGQKNGISKDILGMGNHTGGAGMEKPRRQRRGSREADGGVSELKSKTGEAGKGQMRRAQHPN